MSSAPSSQRFAVRAAIFDLDGTLVATDRFWPDAARAGALRAFAELGLDAAPPESEVWMDMVGQPLEDAFAAAFPELEDDARSLLLARCVEEEHRLLDEGRAGLLPGVTEALAALRADGVRVGVASNCSGAYLDQMMRGLGLEQWVEEPRCLDSPGIRDKGDMVEDLLLTFGTRHAVMVGDRAGDRDAAWANGLPHVHLARGYAARGEEFEAEGCIPGMDALVPLLEERRARTEGLLGALEVPGRAARVLVTGLPFSGARALAQDLAQALRTAGRSASFVDGTGWLRPDGLRAEGPPLAAVAAALDLAAADAALSAPLEAGAARVVACPFGLHPALLTPADRIVWVEASAEVRLRRALGEQGRFQGLAALEDELQARSRLTEALVRAFPPSRLTHLQVDCTDALRPARALAPPSGPALS
ncbi:MAG: HAD family hydrolase [Planctomycetes bacterium]|nr:HAD family hydrolase [Planctomycetota bacterium]